ncbi:AAA ATPase [Mayamaea pseudoterrestris]|nr:AAA ATPase [Mayamaea pseudoterrestris]GKZ00122.1 AAA ATPase [Mayamaea pseudoterrestris]
MPWSLFAKDEDEKPDEGNEKRYFQDMQDALLMRRPAASSSTDVLDKQEKAVLHKLNQAAELKRVGKSKEALALYETALDEGLQLCRRLDHQTSLKNRLRIAMTDAENIKASITKQPKPAMNGKLSELQQSIIDDFYVDSSSLQSTSWSDIAGLEAVKQSLQENVILPLLRPDLFQMGLRKPQNILLYGPPGTGKTMLVRACALESPSCHLFVCAASSLVSKWMGESEKIVKCLFETARSMEPASILFIDELDSVLGRRKSEEHEASRRLKTEFMVQLDGIQQKQQQQSHVIVIGCTNCPFDVDEAVIRRFPKMIYVPLPDAKTRRALIKKLLGKAGKHTLTKADIDWLVEQTKGYSCSDITALASEASYGPLRSLGGVDAIRKVKAQDIRPIAIEDFESALKQSTRSVSNKLLKQYSDWKREHASM